jgi:enoyl-CoA hydratase
LEGFVSESAILLDRRSNGIAVITLNRPEKLNALSTRLRALLMEAFDELEHDDEVKVVVIHGAGDRAFVAGADVSEFAARSPEEQRAVYQERRIYETVADFPKPVIAAIHGFCLGGGCELALACDIRVADTTARIGQAEIRIGLIPGGGGTQRLARLVGHGQTIRMALTGDMIDAAEAFRIGLVEFLTDEGGHLDQALDLASRMARWSGVALRLGKEATRAALELPLSRGLEAEKELFLQAFASEDGREGVQAFVEKRPPRFKGR